MNDNQTKMSEMEIGLGGEIMDEEQGRDRPLWLSAVEADILLSMCSLSPVSAGELEDSLFRKMGKLIASFETPHPKEL